MTQFLSNREIYESVICALVLQTRERLWIAAFIAPILWRKMFPSKKRRDNTLDRIDMINRIYLNLEILSILSKMLCALCDLCGSNCSQSDRLIKF